MSVVLIGEGGYEELELLAAAVEERGAEAVVWDVTDWPGDVPLTYDVGAGTFTVGREVDPEEVTGVFPVPRHVFDMLRPRFTDQFETEGTAQLSIKLTQWRAVFNSLLGVLDRHGATVFYPPWAQHYHETKPMQLEQFASEGIAVPDTVFAADPDRIRSFVEEHGEVVYKSISVGALPNRLSAEDLEDAPLDRLSNAPVQFQEYVPGEDLRVYVLDDEVVAASRYVTDDWSFKENPPEDAERVELRDEVRRDVERAAAVSPIRFGAADVRATDDSHALLELNPAPRFAFHDHNGATDIAGALADRLV